MRFFRTAAAFLCATGILLASACSGGRREPNSPLEVDLTPAIEEGKVTPPFWVAEDEQTGAQVFLLGSMHAGLFLSALGISGSTVLLRPRSFRSMMGLWSISEASVSTMSRLST